MIQGCLTQALLFIMYCQYNEAKGKIKKKISHLEWNRIKLSILVDNIIIYVGHQMESTEKLLELLSEFNKVTGYKKNMQKSMYFYILAKNH